MRKPILLFLFLFTYTIISGQLTITPGAAFHVSGNTLLTLNNTDMVNNGVLTAGSGKISFTGNSSSAISGSQPVQFYELEINKTSGSQVLLQRMISISQQISFSQGFLNLNGFDSDLGTTGSLAGENETSHITGSNGGRVLIATTLNAPSSANPANLGAIITSSQNLGNVIVGRGHQSQQNASGVGSSILRYYDITASNNSNLTATLRFHYFDGELNGLSEGSLVFWKKATTTWTNEGFTTRNITGNYVEKVAISSFSRWTLSTADNSLPVRFILFNIKCEGNKVIITWKTAQEQNSSHFIVQKSPDAANWTGIATIPAAGNSTSEQSYSFTDNTVTEGSYYRVAQYDIDGRVQYTSVIPLSCNITDDFKVWPNPFNDILFVNIRSNARSQVTIKIYDMKGALVRVQQEAIWQGSNQLSMDMKGMAGGMYQLSAEWNGGQVRKAIKVIKK
jgi:hypothetical protein